MKRKKQQKEKKTQEKKQYDKDQKIGIQKKKYKNTNWTSQFSRSKIEERRQNRKEEYREETVNIYEHPKCQIKNDLNQTTRDYPTLE